MKTKDKKTWKVVPFKVKKEAIDELQNEWATIESLSEKFNVIPNTIKKWRKQVNYETSGNVNKIYTPESEKRKIVRKIESGVLTLKEAVIQLGLRNKETINRWIKIYSSDIYPMSEEVIQKKDKEFLNAKSVKNIEEALLKAQLKITSLETLIDVAEKELNIDIRKKSGTKQS
jgi:transposase